MPVTQTLDALGSWSLTLSDTCPNDVVAALGYFGHVIILRGDVDIDSADPTTLLQQARYVGVLREKPTSALTLAGSGMLFWLGNENGQPMRETKLALSSASLSACVAAALPASVHAGTVNSAAGTYSGNHQWETPRQTLDTITTYFGVEYRVNGDATVDVGTQAQLYRAVPNTILSARGAGADLDVKSIGTQFAPDLSAVDYTTRVVLLGQTTNSAGASTSFAEATADAATIPYKDMFGNPVSFTRGISDSGQTSGSVAAAAQLALNRFNRLTQIVKVTAEDYEIDGDVVVGDNAWVYDPDNGIVDPSKELDFHGEKINPAVVRISGATWPVTADHRVAFRTQTGQVIDLTRWVVWESGTTDLTIGDLPKTLTSGSNPVQQRVDGAPDGTTPNAPTALSLSTSSYQSSTGQASATITASWTAPTTNTDGSVITDFSYYVVQYRPHFRAPAWMSAGPVSTTSIDIPGLAVGLLYDVQVATVDTTGHMSAFTPVAQITAAPDTTAPSPPSDPTVTSYLGQLRIAWDGKDNTGAAMPPDFAIVEVHVSATSGFTPVSGPGSSTLVDQLSTAGVSYATAPYGAARYVKLVAVDNSGNRSAPSGQVSGSTVQVGDGDIAAMSVGKLTAGTIMVDVVMGGRFATALTGARVEMNSLGFQKFDTDGVTKLVSITGTEALMTGTFKTASSGRRIEMLSAGSTGSIDFYAPDGRHTQVSSFTSSAGSPGAEAIRMGYPITSGAASWWNSYITQSNELSTISSAAVQVYFGGSTSSTSKIFRVLYTPTSDDAGTGSFTGEVVRFAITPSVGQFVGTDNNIRARFGDSTTGFTNSLTQFWGSLSSTYDRVEIASPNTNFSPPIRFVTTGNIGGAIRLAPGGIEIVSYDQTVYTNINASSFTVSSDSSTKTAIRKLAADPVEIITGLDVVQYRRKKPAAARHHVQGRDEDAKVAPPTSVAYPTTEVGVLADNLHPLLQRGEPGNRMVDLGSTLFTSIAVLQKVLDRLDRLEGKAA